MAGAKLNAQKWKRNYPAIQWLDLVVLAVLSLLLLLPPVQGSNFTAPQYLALNIIPYEDWNQDVASSITRDIVDSMVTAVGTTGSDRRRLAFSFLFYFMQSSNFTGLQAALRRVLEVSVETGVPVGLTLDGWVWWAEFPELWNWWNSSMPGYNASNVYNVEWTSWTPKDAVAIAWRNWGSQIRVPTPHPNLASPALLAIVTERASILSRIIADWYNSLPASSRYLLCDVKLASEASIGANYYFYPNGNLYLQKPVSADPTCWLWCTQQVGFAAATTLNLASSGPMTSRILDQVLQHFQTSVATVVRAAGLPRSKLFTHVGANFGDMPLNQSWASVDSAFIPLAQPGFSIYSFSNDPSKAQFLGQQLELLGGLPWGVCEYFYEGGNPGSTYQQWLLSLQNVLSYFNNKMLHIYNWDSIKASTDICQAIHDTLATPLTCLPQPASGVTAAKINDTAVALSWTPAPPDNDSLYLLISDTSHTQAGTGLPTRVHRKIAVSDISTIVVNKLQSNTTYYVYLLGEGCSGQKRSLSDVVSFSL